jgi:hypothetical protein
LKQSFLKIKKKKKKILVLVGTVTSALWHVALFYFMMAEPTYMLLFIFSRFLENPELYSYFAAKLWEAPKDWLRWRQAIT